MSTEAVALGVEYIALSFVRKAGDLEELRRLVPKRVRIVAKIEKDTALSDLCGILEASDAIMVARGDLGVELPFEEVPLAQKRIIREANLHGKPVITATQMLESMIHAPIPTRAEASDVANAILDGTDAVMLSAETAVGDYPLEAVMAMDRIAREMESHRSGRSPALDAAVGRRGPGRPATRCTPARGSGKPARTEDAIGVAVVCRGRAVALPAHRLLHQQRLHRAEGRDLPPHGADFRRDSGAGDLPAACPGLGHRPRPHRPLHRLRLAAARGSAGDPSAGPGQAW